MSTPMNDDEIRLAKLGYKQGLKRQFTAFQNFGFVLTNASVLIGIVPLFKYGLQTGGPLTLTWGWLLVGSFVVCIGLCMAEICSTYPTAGGLYYWTAKLGGSRYGPVFSWFEAWFNSLGQIAGASGSVLSASAFLVSLVKIWQPDWDINDKHIFAVHCILVISGAMINTIGGLGLKATSLFSVYVHIIGTIVIVATVLATAPTKQSASFVFGEFRDLTGFTDPGNGFSPVLVFLLGLLPSQWSMLGYDSSAHMSEETQQSYINGPRGIILSVIASIVMGWALILGLLFSIQDYDGTVAGGAQQLFVDCAGNAGGSFLIMIIVAAGWCCGIATIAANSRMFYAFARDGGLPYSAFWSKVDSRTGMPIRLVWLSALLVIILAIPSMFSLAALSAVSGISIIGFLVSYAIPIFLRVTIGAKTFVQSEFNCGRWTPVLGWIGVIWTALAFVVFNLPQLWPVNADNFSYTPAAVGFLLIFAGGWWIIDARKWFKGPIMEIAEEELAADATPKAGVPVVEARSEATL
ncbi:hypothetical protein HK104_010841 [Borealophlyctis nickersoniae]|nr:hypothetical protein HK104_010841 [Borealophlyctis nickersoniae]